MASVVTEVTPTPTNFLNGQPHSSPPHSQLNTILIATIAVCFSLLVVAVVAAVYVFVIRPKRQRQKVPPSRMFRVTEKYRKGEDSEYTPSLAFSQFSRDPRGIASLLETPTSQNRVISQPSYLGSQTDVESGRFLSEDPLLAQFINDEDEITQVHLGSQTDVESGRFLSEDPLLAQFINGGDEITQVLPSHVVSFKADETPYAQPEESHLDSVALLSSPPRSPSPKSLPPLPADTAPPSRRPSRRKQSRSGSGYNSDDSESMYSQASASTVRFPQTLSRSISVNGEFPASPAVPLPVLPPLPSQLIPSSFVVLTPEEEAEQKGMARENTILVAKLLKSRAKHASPELSRDLSGVSHIERSGSIHPVLENEGGNQRGKRHLRKLRERKLHVSRLSTTAMAESVSQEMEGMTPPPSATLN